MVTKISRSLRSDATGPRFALRLPVVAFRLNRAGVGGTSLRLQRVEGSRTVDPRMSNVASSSNRRPTFNIQYGSRFVSRFRTRSDVGVARAHSAGKSSLALISNRGLWTAIGGETLVAPNR